MSSAELNVRILLAVGVVIVAARAVAWVFGRWGQPRVLGEIVAGVLLGSRCSRGSCRSRGSREGADRRAQPGLRRRQRRRRLDRGRRRDRDSSASGPGGITEIVIVSTGLQLGLISPVVFTAMVLMAPLTTAMAAPALRLVRGDRAAAAAG